MQDKTIYARTEAGKVAVYHDAGCTQGMGAFPFDAMERLDLKPHKTREVEAHGVKWLLLWMPAI